MERKQDSGAKVCSVRGLVPETKTQFMRSILDSNAGKFYDGHPRSVKFYEHRQITVEGLAKSAGVTEEEMKGHLTYMLGLLDLLTRAHEYVPDWVKIFFTTLWIPRCGGYDLGYPWKTTWAAPLGVVQPVR